MSRAQRFSSYSDELLGQFTVPEAVAGWVIIGSSRRNQRLERLAPAFSRRGLATAFFDLGPPDDTAPFLSTRSVLQLTERLAEATCWLREAYNDGGLPMGYFGVSIDGAAALGAAARLGGLIRAVVTWEGRPDLVKTQLRHVRAPTLLLVSEPSRFILELNERAQWWMRCVRRLAVVPGIVQLFGERRSLHSVSTLSGAWYQHHLLGKRPLKSWPGQLFGARFEEHCWTRAKFLA